MSSGRPVTLDVRVVQPETGAELPDGRVGEIRVRGRSVRGYWRSPAQTRAAFEAFSRRPRIRPPGRPPRSGWTAPSPPRRRAPSGRPGERGRRSPEHPRARRRGAGRHRAGDQHRRGRGDTLNELAALTKQRVAGAFGLPALSIVLSKRGAVRRTTSGKMQRRLTRQAFLDGQIAVLADLEPGITALRPARA